MRRSPGFAEILDAADQLDTDSQAELIAILGRRLAERGRQQVVASVAESRRQFAEGLCEPMTAGDPNREASS